MIFEELRNSGTFPFFQVLDMFKHVDDKVNRPTSGNIRVKLARQKANRLVSNNAKTKFDFMEGGEQTLTLIHGTV